MPFHTLLDIGRWLGTSSLVVTDLHRLASILGAFIVVTNTDAALAAEATGPETLN